MTAIADARLDHVAVAVEDQSQAWPRYAGELAGEWLAGGATVGFVSGQLTYANGMRLEVLAPHQAQDNDFLRRFLDHAGPGPHHLTYKVPDLALALARAEEAGYRPVGVDLSQDDWKEGFLHPRDAPGVVVQLAQSSGEWEGPPPPALAAPQAPSPATLVHVAHAVASLDEGLRLFAGLLGGTEAGRGDDGTCSWVDLTWAGPGAPPGAPPVGRARLLAPSGEGSPLWGWLGRRPGRVHHLAFALADPGRLASARPASGVPAASRAGGRAASFVVEPEDNLGTRLLLSEPELERRD